VLEDAKSPTLRVETSCEHCKCEHFVAPGTNCWAKEQMSDVNPCMAAIPVRGSDESAKSFDERVASDLNQLVPAIQTHTAEHVPETCFKAYFNRLRKQKGLAQLCRFDFPRPIELFSRFTEHGKIVLKRLHHFTNNFNPWITVAARCNSDIQTLWGSDTGALSIVFYVTNYATKLQRNLLVRRSRFAVVSCRIGQTMLPRITQALKKREEHEATLRDEAASMRAKDAAAPQAASEDKRSVPDPNAPQLESASDEKQSNATTKKRSNLPEDLKQSEWDARSLLTRLEYQIERDSEFSATTVDAHFLGLEERVTSHKFEKMVIWPFLQHAEEADKQSGHPEDTSFKGGHEHGEQLVISRSGKTAAKNLRWNYCLRPEGLGDIGLYDFVSYYECVSRSAARQGDVIFQFEAPHECRWSMCVRLRKEPVVPLYYGPPLPAQAKDEARFAKFMLCLFKPFRDESELHADGQKWMDAFKAFEASASPRVRALLENFSPLQTARKAHATDVQRKNAERLARMAELDGDGKASEALARDAFYDADDDEDVDFDGAFDTEEEEVGRILYKHLSLAEQRNKFRSLMNPLQFKPVKDSRGGMEKSWEAIQAAELFAPETQSKRNIDNEAKVYTRGEVEGASAQTWHSDFRRLKALLNDPPVDA
jgi:hypothetical protein